MGVYQPLMLARDFVTTLSSFYHSSSGTGWERTGPVVPEITSAFSPLLINTKALELAVCKFEGVDDAHGFSRLYFFHFLF